MTAHWRAFKASIRPAWNHARWIYDTRLRLERLAEHWSGS